MRKWFLILIDFISGTSDFNSLNNKSKEEIIKQRILETVSESIKLNHKISVRLRSGTELGLYNDPPLWKLEEEIFNLDGKAYERDYTI